ncbi:hypothetical protein E2C01_062809 [Portunus trituberculatus]|uniref:Uncharacterized protein n=1 Tax=Portunus trituberculatus TaxID=210409 RepID=A0A5B7HH35_PORTR|nr:hypothetical protein [Portunus trituberculatus]
MFQRPLKNRLSLRRARHVVAAKSSSGGVLLTDPYWHARLHLLHLSPTVSKFSVRRQRRDARRAQKKSLSASMEARVRLQCTALPTVPPQGSGGPLASPRLVPVTEGGRERQTLPAHSASEGRGRAVFSPQQHSRNNIN